jgi:transmembrane sensor
MSFPPDPELLDRYFAGECTEEESTLVRQYLAAHPAESAIINHFRNRLEGEGMAPSTAEIRASWSALKSEWQTTPVSQRTPSGVQRNPSSAFVRLVRPRYAGWGVAAAILVGVALAGWGVRSSLRERAMINDTPAAVSSGEREFYTTNGQRSTVQLPDGSEILLNVGTRVRIPHDYGKGKRTVHLDGEARFAVQHDSAAPFVVHANGARIEDLGTIFVVRSYKGEANTRVAVVSGVVAVARDSTEDSEVRLEKNDAAIVDAGQTLVRHAADLHEYTDWIDGRLVFRSVPIRQALAELERWYALSFELEDSSIGSKTLTATFEGHAITQEVIELLAASLATKVERRGSVVRLVPLRQGN